MPPTAGSARVFGQTDEQIPVTVVCGLAYDDGAGIPNSSGVVRRGLHTSIQLTARLTAREWFCALTLPTLGPADPEPTDPEPTDPEPTDPEPAEPAPCQQISDHPTMLWRAPRERAAGGLASACEG
jgi:hypothetical protein